ncbi:hypothetical protein JCM3765_005706 [Sporobolomyces pararoseus]
MPASDYKHKPGGGLKLKGGPADPSKKKKKKSTSSKKSREGGEEGESREVTRRSEVDGDDREGRSESPVVASGSSSSGPAKTKAQLRFEEVQRQRLLERARKAALKSHKDRVAEFNEQLEALSQHYDIPKASSTLLVDLVVVVLILSNGCTGWAWLKRWESWKIESFRIFVVETLHSHATASVVPLCSDAK